MIVGVRIGSPPIQCQGRSPFTQSALPAPSEFPFRKITQEFFHAISAA